MVFNILFIIVYCRLDVLSLSMICLVVYCVYYGVLGVLIDSVLVG